MSEIHTFQKMYIHFFLDIYGAYLNKALRADFIISIKFEIVFKGIKNKYLSPYLPAMLDLEEDMKWVSCKPSVLVHHLRCNWC